MVSRNRSRTLAALLLVGAPWVHAQELPLLEPAQTLGPANEETFPGPPGNAPDTLHFGESIAVDGNTALIGLPEFDGSFDAVDSIGRVAIFTRGRSGIWQRTGSLDPSQPAAFEHFGNRVALSRQTALVGAISGVYLFRRDRGTWRQVQKIGNPPGEPLDGGVAIGDRVAFFGSIGINAAGGADQPGSVRAYRIDKRGRLQFVQRLTADDGTAANRFGARLAVAGDVLVVGASGDDELRGAAYVFRATKSGWSQRQKLIAMNGGPGERFGAAVAAVRDRIAIGAPQANPREAQPPGSCPASLSGAVFVFTQHNRIWSQQQELGALADCITHFASEVAISRDWLIATAPSIFPDQFANPAVFERRSGAYADSAEAMGSEAGVATLAIDGSRLFTGFPRDRAFSTGEVDVYQLVRNRQ